MTAVASAAAADAAVDVDAFRREFGDWLDAHLPADWSQRAGTSEAEVVEWDRWWLSELHAGGYAVPHWPSRFGGRDASLEEEIALYEVLGERTAPWPATFYCALNHAANTIMTLGDDHHLDHLPRILAGDEIWCQAFSEPDAGSDLASVRTVARRDGDHYILNGQKTWSSMSPHADWALLLARTDREATGRNGLTYLLLDMRLAGVTVRPIRHMTGKSTMGEIFLDDVRLPVTHRIGPEGDGWRIACYTLGSERGPGFVRFATTLRTTLRDLVGEFDALSRGPRRAEAGLLTEDLGRACCDVVVLERLGRRVLSQILRTGQPGPEASLLKVLFSEALQRSTDLALRIEGVAGHVVGRPTRVTFEEGPLILRSLQAYSSLIGAGTNEIQRNMIGERVLGLPRERTGP